MCLSTAKRAAGKPRQRQTVQHATGLDSLWTIARLAPCLIGQPTLPHFEVTKRDPERDKGAVALGLSQQIGTPTSLVQLLKFR